MLKYVYLILLILLLNSNINAQKDKLINFKTISQNCLNDDLRYGKIPNLIDLDSIKNNFFNNEILKIIFTKSEIISESGKLKLTHSIKESINENYLELNSKFFKIPIIEYKPDSEHFAAFCVYKLKYNNRIREELTVPNWLCIFINPIYKNLLSEDSFINCIKKHYKNYPFENFPLVKIGNLNTNINIINEILQYTIRIIKENEKKREKFISEIIKLQNEFEENYYEPNKIKETSLAELEEILNIVKSNTNKIKQKKEKEKNKRIEEEMKRNEIISKNNILKNICEKLIDSLILKTENYPDDNKNYRNSKLKIVAINTSDSLDIKEKIKECLDMIEDKKTDIKLNFESLIEKLNAIISGLNEQPFKGVSINLNFLQSYFNYNFNNNLLDEKITHGNGTTFSKIVGEYALPNDFNKYNGKYLQTNKIKNNKIFQSGNENFILNHFYVSAIAKLNPTKLFKLKKPIENLLVGAGIGIGFINYKSSVTKSIDKLEFTYDTQIFAPEGPNSYTIKRILNIVSNKKSENYTEEHIFTNSLIYLNLIDLSVQYKIPIKKNKFSIEDVQFNLGFSAGLPISFTSKYYAYYKSYNNNKYIYPLPNTNLTNLKAGLITNFYVNPILNLKIKNQLIGLGLLISMGSVGLNNESSDAIEKTGIENSLNSLSIKNFGFNIVYHFSKK